MNRNKKSNLHITYFFVFIFIILFLLFYYLMGASYSAFLSPLTGSLLMALLFTSFSVIIFLSMQYNSLLQELDRFRQITVNNDNDIELTKDDRKISFPATSDINYAIREISMDVRKQVKKLNECISKPKRKNSRLSNEYKQLESSYAQLQMLMEKLNESEQRYHSLVINIPDLVLTLDSCGNITYANRACRDILNFRRHDIEGKPFQYIIQEGCTDAFNFEELKQCVEEKGEHLLRIPLRKKDGTSIHAEIKFTPSLKSPQGSSIQAIIRDVTEQKRLETVLVESNRRLEIINDFSKKIASALELNDIYKTCVNTLTKSLRFPGAMYLMAEKKEKCFRIVECSGNYFVKPDAKKPFLRINRKICSYNNKSKEGIVLDFNTFVGLLSAGPGNIENILPFEAVYIQELKISGVGSGLLLVIIDRNSGNEELDILRSIGNTTAVAIENAMHLIKSKDYYVATINALIAAVEARDQYTRGHSQRVSALAVKIAEEMGMSKEQIEELRIAGILHDIGKIGISDRILLKKGPLTKEEYEEIKKHPAISNRILYPIGLSDRILKAIAFHHERYDGRGYPFGLSNESLGLEPQIIAVADAFDAMTSKRPYREPLSLEEAIRELENNKGSQFHPDIVDVMVRIQKSSNKILV